VSIVTVPVQLAVYSNHTSLATVEVLHPPVGRTPLSVASVVSKAVVPSVTTLAFAQSSLAGGGCGQLVPAQSVPIP